MIPSGYTRQLLQRELGTQRRSTNRNELSKCSRDVTCKLEGSVIVAPSGTPSIPYTLAFSHRLDNGNLLATACEDGFVTILDASKRLPYNITGEDGAMPRAHWKAHHNAIFDVVWSKVGSCRASG